MSIQIDAATLCYSLYDYPDSPRVGWDYLDDGSGSDGVYWAAVRLNGILWTVLRGSVTDKDWQRDFYTFVDPFLHDELGTIHPGFYKGLPLVCSRLLSLAKLQEPIGVTGHSLGAGRASLLTGLLCVAGYQPAHRIVFGEPHSGGDKLSQIVETVPAFSYRNTGGPDADWEDFDQVTAVPPWFKTPGPRTDETVVPEPNDPWGFFRYHHMSLYAKAVGIEQTWNG